MNVRSAGLSLAVASALFIACGGLTQHREQAEKNVVTFHDLFNQARFDEIYAGSSPEFRRMTAAENFTELLDAVRRKLGNVTHTKNLSWRVTTSNALRYVLLVQETSFREGRAVETFSYVMKDGTPVLVGYNINSNELVTR
jgi:hypothetical protein